MLAAIHVLVYTLVGVLALMQIGIFFIPAKYYSPKMAGFVWEISFVHLSLEKKTILYVLSAVIAFAFDLAGHFDLAMVCIAIAVTDMIVLYLTTHSYGLRKLAAIYKRSEHYHPNALSPHIPPQCTMIARQTIETAYWDKTPDTIAVEACRRGSDKKQ